MQIQLRLWGRCSQRQRKKPHWILSPSCCPGPRLTGDSDGYTHPQGTSGGPSSHGPCWQHQSRGQGAGAERPQAHPAWQPQNLRGWGHGAEAGPPPHCQPGARNNLTSAPTTLGQNNPALSRGPCRPRRTYPHTGWLGASRGTIRAERLGTQSAPSWELRAQPRQPRRHRADTAGQCFPTQS